MSSDKSENPMNIENTTKLAQKNILENNNMIAALDSNLAAMNEELAELKYKKMVWSQEQENNQRMAKVGIRQFVEEEKVLLQEAQKADAAS